MIRAFLSGIYNPQDKNKQMQLDMLPLLGTEKTDALGNITSYEYDPNGNLTHTIDQFGNVTAHEYDADGNLMIERADSCSLENYPLATLP